ncbi:MAG: NADH-quinone oxidoreductase subunit C [Desulfobulbaceae bacterium]|nr:NADH-quinone oxidoreductase subunit C [Desulfobulbaceae bacterium]
MTREELTKEIHERFTQDIIEFSDRSPDRIYVDIEAQAIVPVATYIFNDVKARFNIASAVDVRSHIEILYHFTVEYLSLLLSVRVKLDRMNPSIDSLAPVFKGANWIEREMGELLGIEFKGHPNFKRLVLSDEWPKGVYPLRRDYQEWDTNAIRDRGV